MSESVTIAIPSRDFIHTNFALSLISMALYSRVPIYISNIRSSILPVSRSMLVERAQENKSEYILFLDSDMVFPPDTLKRLLAHDKDIVCATYCRREGTTEPMGCTAEWESITADAIGVGEAGRVPMGVMLIRMSVFEKMDKPYFRWAINQGRSEIVGEDAEFCDRARALGFKVYVDMELSRQVGHIGEVTRFIGTTHS